MAEVISSSLTKAKQAEGTCREVGRLAPRGDQPSATRFGQQTANPPAPIGLRPGGFSLSIFDAYAYASKIDKAIHRSNAYVSFVLGYLIRQEGCLRRLDTNRLRKIFCVQFDVECVSPRFELCLEIAVYAAGFSIHPCRCLRNPEHAKIDSA